MALHMNPFTLLTETELLSGAAAFFGLWVLSGVPAPFIRQLRGYKPDLRFVRWMALDIVLLGPFTTLLALL